MNENGKEQELTGKEVPKESGPGLQKGSETDLNLTLPNNALSRQRRWAERARSRERRTVKLARNYCGNMSSAQCSQISA